MHLVTTSLRIWFVKDNIKYYVSVITATVCPHKYLKVTTILFICNQTFI